MSAHAYDKASPAWASARNILCIRLDALGDVLMTTPALRALKELPQRPRLTLLTSAAGAAVAPFVSEIDATIAYAAPWLKATAANADPAADFAMIERLRAHGFDAAVIFTVYSQNPLPSALTAYLAGIPLRLAHCRENPYQLLSDWIPETEPAQHIRHEVRRQLDLVAHVGARTANERLSLHPPTHARTRVRSLFEALGFKALGPRVSRPLVLVHPGASAPSRRYPAAQYAAAVSELAAAGCDIVFTGDANEAELVRQIQAEAATGSTALVGALNLGELAAAIEHADLLLCNNTGPAHIAAAVGTPVVDLYALTNPQHTPWLVPARVLSQPQDCGYCYRSVCARGDNACLAQIPPRAVAAAALSLLAETRSACAPRPTAHSLRGEEICIP